MLCITESETATVKLLELRDRFAREGYWPSCTRVNVNGRNFTIRLAPGRTAEVALMRHGGDGRYTYLLSYRSGDERQVDVWEDDPDKIFLVARSRRYALGYK